MEDPRILEQAAAGSEQAWVELVYRYRPMLLAVAGTMRMQPCDAEDAAQLTWIALRENITGIREPQHVGAWLGVVMRRRCLAVLAQQRRELLDEHVGDRAAEYSPPPEPLPGIGIVWNLVDRLPERERAVLRALFAGTDRSYRDIARDLGIPIGSVGPVRMRALRRLSRMLVDTRVDAGPSASHPSASHP